MKTVFSPFFYEYIRFDAGSGFPTLHNGRSALALTGTGTVSGKEYSIYLIDGEYDDRCTMQL